MKLVKDANHATFHYVGENKIRIGLVNHKKKSTYRKQTLKINAGFSRILSL